MISRVMQKQKVAALVVLLALASACASAPVRQVQAGIADQIDAISKAVLEVQTASHTAAMALNTPEALRIDLEIQQVARGYGVMALGALAKVKAAPNTVAALVAGSPIIAEALALLEKLKAAPFLRQIDPKVVALQAKISALEQQGGK